jgi:hypothetical protein
MFFRPLQMENEGLERERGIHAAAAPLVSKSTSRPKPSAAPSKSISGLKPISLPEMIPIPIAIPTPKK